MAQIIGEYFPWMVVEDSEDSPQHIEKLQRRQCELRDLDLANDQVLRREWNALIMHLDNCLRLNYGVNNDLDDDVDHHHRSKPARYMPKSKSAHQVNGLNDDDNDDEDEDEGDDQDSVTPYVSSDESPTRLRTTAQDIDFLSPPPSEIITNTWSKSSKKSKASKFNIDFFDDEDEVVDEEVDNNILEEFENGEQNVKADEQLKKFIQKKKIPLQIITVCIAFKVAHEGQTAVLSKSKSETVITSISTNRTSIPTVFENEEATC